VLKELQQGGTILVEFDGGEAFLGVLTRDEGPIGGAEIALLIETGHVPALEELLRAMIAANCPDRRRACLVSSRATGATHRSEPRGPAALMVR
jgi:hypothetical protein